MTAWAEAAAAGARKAAAAAEATTAGAYEVLRAAEEEAVAAQEACGGPAKHGLIEIQTLIETRHS